MDSDSTESSPIQPWRVLFAVFHGLLSVVGCFVMVNFYRQRTAFFLKERYPGLALLQLGACAMGAFIEGFVCPLTLGTPVHCFLRDIVVNVISSLVMYIHVARAWKLYWRIFLGKRFAQSRTVLRSKIENQSSEQSSISSSGLGSTTGSREQFKTWKFKAMKYSILGFFGLLLVSEVLFVLGQYAFSNLRCNTAGNTAARVFGVTILVSGVVAAAALLVLVQKFQDSFNIHLEILRTTVVYFIACPLLLALTFVDVRTPDNQLVTREVIPFLFEIFIVIVGVYPLYDQRKLNKTVKECESVDLERLEDVLEHPASFVALQTFMHREFCDELLEFYQAVGKFKRKYELQSSEKRLNAARVIYAQFVSPGAPAQINLSLNHIAAVHVKLFGGADRRQSNLAELNLVTDVPFTVFDNAQREIVNLIRRGVFIRFQVSRLPPQASTRRKSLSLRRFSLSNNDHPRPSSARPSILSGVKALVSTPSSTSHSQSPNEQTPSGRRKSQSRTRRVSFASRRGSLYGEVPADV